MSFGSRPDRRGRSTASGWIHAARVALTPAAAPWAVMPALGTTAAVGTVAVLGALTDQIQAVGMAYFGAACAAVFAGRGPYRLRMQALAAQAAGACLGLAVGAITYSPADTVVVAAGVAFASGIIGSGGRALTAGGFMAVIGVAFAQFGGSTLSWYEQAGCYLIGTLALAVVALAPWLVHRDRPERAAVVAVLTCSAELFERAGTPAAGPARTALAAATAAARDGVFGGRVSLRFARRPRGHEIYAGWRYATALALAAAAAHADHHPQPQQAAAARAAAERLRSGGIGVAEPPIAPPARRTASEIITPTLLGTGLRLAWCMAIATAVTEYLHKQNHSVWIVLTVAVLVRPEYASVFVRTVNRVAGTLAGAIIAAAVLLVAGHGLPVAICAAASIGFAVAAAPRLYALSVIGVTCSALLSACIGSADPTYPLIRLADTALGAAIAIVFGYLLWPGRGDPEPSMGLIAGKRAARAYLDGVLAAVPLDPLRDRAYSAAHRTRAIASSALLEPPPIADAAATVLTQAIALESTVDEITSLASRDDRVDVLAAGAARLRHQLDPSVPSR